MYFKRGTLFKAFAVSQFNYFPLAWMFRIKELNNRTNGLYERALRITYQDRMSSLDELLKNDKSLSVHHKILQRLLLEIYKVKMGLSPSVMNDIISSDQNAS